jgi:hypothetical protein
VKSGELCTQGEAVEVKRIMYPIGDCEVRGIMYPGGGCGGQGCNVLNRRL